MVEMEVESVRVNLLNPNRVVVLKEKERERYLAIVIGGSEADAIAIKLQDRNVQRPLTHDLIKSIIDNVGAQVLRITVSNLVDQVYYANIVIQSNGGELDIDSRPSDAIALAVRTGVPILVSEEVLEVAGIEPSAEDEVGRAEESEGVTEEELKPFREFINQLDLDDLGHE